MRLRSSLVAPFCVAALLSVANPARAQGCGLNDDGFAGVPCCMSTSPALPVFPAFAISGEYACVKHCAVEATFPVRVTTAHVPVLCDIHLVQFATVPSAAGAPGMAGILAAKYARTWTEPPTTPGLPPRQVWRFLVNGDLTFNAGVRPCPVPPHPGNATSNFHGHMDYACEVDANNNTRFALAMSLHHLTGCVEHNLLGCAPMGGAAAHLDRSYHLVAPGGFAWGAAPVTAGPVVLESARSASFLPAYGCSGEAAITQVTIVPGSPDCPCVVPPIIGNPWVHDTWTASTACGGATGAISSVALGPPLPPLPTGTTQIPIGSWTGTAGGFPGTRTLMAHWGVLRYQDACNPNDPPFHFVQGVSTAGGMFMPFGTTTGPFVTALDVQDMLDPNALVGQPLRPCWGSLFVSKLVFSMNL